MTSANSKRQPSLRTFFFRIHAWLGLYSFIVFFLLFASGTLLVFIDEIEATIAKLQRLDPAPASKGNGFGAVYDGVLASRPDDRILYIIRTDSSWIADRVRVQQREGIHQATLWANPVSGENQGEADFSNFRSIVRGFHDGFVLGRFPGNLFVTAFSIPLLYFLISGLIVYRRFWRGFFRLPTLTKGPRAFWSGLHRILALWLLPFLLIIALTSLVYLVEGLTNRFYADYPEFQKASERKDVLPAGFNGAALDRASEAALGAMPDLDIKMVVFPKDTTGPLLFYGEATAWIVNLKGNAVAVDPVDGSVLGSYRGEDLSLMTRIISSAEPLHYGYWSGFTVRIFWLLFGIMATCLTLAGIMVSASRLAGEPGMENRSNVSRVWHGMNFLKWGVALFIIAIVALVLVRFGPF